MKIMFFQASFVLEYVSQLKFLFLLVRNFEDGEFDIDKLFSIIVTQIVV